MHSYLGEGCIHLAVGSPLSKGSVKEGGVQRHGRSRGLQQASIAHACRHDEGLVSSAHSVTGTDRATAKSSDVGLQSGVRLRSKLAVGLDRGAVEVVLESRQSKRVGQYGGVPNGPLVVPGLVVVADSHLRDGGDLHALQDVPGPGHAVLDGYPKLLGRRPHLHQPVPTEEEVPLEGGKVVVDGVEPVLLVDPEVPLPLRGGEKEAPETGVVGEGVVAFDDEVILSAVLLRVVSIGGPVPVVGQDGPARLLSHHIDTVGKDGWHGSPVFDAIGDPLVVPPRVDLEIPERYGLLVCVALYGQQDVFVVGVRSGIVIVACTVVCPVPKVIVGEIVSANRVVFPVPYSQQLSPRFHRPRDILTSDDDRFEDVFWRHRVDGADDAESDGWGRGCLGLPAALRSSHEGVGGRDDDGVAHVGVEYDQRSAAIYAAVERHAW